MVAVTRRSIVKGAAAIPFLVWFEKFAWAQTPRVRFNARSTQGQAMLRIYAAAVRRMQTEGQIPSRDPRSWTFQWYTHFVRGDRSKSAELARIYPAPSPQRTLANEMWNTCQAHSGQDENFFLPWHRMYVFFFENIIRNVSGNQSFTLPYWDYSVSGATHGVIPREFTLQNDPTFGSLFVNKRNAGVNTGRPIDQGQPGSPLSLVSLRQCIYESRGAVQGFCLALDAGLHGNVHVLTGNSLNMGQVPWAAGDPIFWMHHCNIDRLWASWNAAGRRNLNTQSFLNKTFVFADGAGNRVVARIRDFLDIAPLGYRYDRLEPVPACPTTTSHLTASVTGARRLLTNRAGAVNLRNAPMRIALDRPAGVTTAEVPMATQLDRLDPNKRLFLVIRNLKTDVQPGVLYHVYLDLPQGAAPAAGAEHHVGNIHFFESGGEHAGHATTERDKFFSFDITDVARKLRARGALSAKPGVTIAPAGTPAAEAKPVVGEITIVEQ